ncbi:unnamed protein product [Clonostachys chloroleuca]|uniref:Pheromone a factor receptor n=1 Tax=Clonostachys chloroleuca TaxID=1926264 RepID=A0AA35M1X4_9HYPO|nr:unnamed protein product [Clonostachys chloroleuca]
MISSTSSFALGVGLAGNAGMHLHARGDGPMIISLPSVPPYTTPSLTANLVMRVLLAVVANLVCLVPLRLLGRNGEFSAVVFIVAVEIKNIQTILNSLLWRDDNTQNWYAGFGICDMASFFSNFLGSLYVTCLLATMRNLAQQVGLLRANPLTAREKRKRNMVQALIMFPLPLLQVAMTWPLAEQRYAIGTLVGCQWLAHGSWPYIAIFVVPNVLVPIATGCYAVLAYFRFRAVAKFTASALSTNRVASQRAQRTRRRLYLMVISILTPFLPITILFFVRNVTSTGVLEPYNYDKIHNKVHPYPWNSVLYVTSNNISFGPMNVAYISILTAIPIFIFFGMTKDAMNDYRKILLFLRLGIFFPRLHQEYDPDRSAIENSSFSGTTQLASSSTTADHKRQAFTSSRVLGSFSSASGQSTHHHLHSLNYMTSPNQDQTFPRPPPPSVPPRRPSTPAAEHVPRSVRYNLIPFRNIFSFPVRYKLPSFLGRSRRPANIDTEAQLPLDSSQPDRWSCGPSGIRTRVWSDDEARLVNSNNTHELNENAKFSAVPTTTLPPQAVVVKTMLTTETSEAGPPPPPQQQQR